MTIKRERERDAVISRKLMYKNTVVYKSFSMLIKYYEKHFKRKTSCEQSLFRSLKIDDNGISNGTYKQ